MKRTQDVASARRLHAERMIARKMAGLQRLMTSIKFWQRRASYYAKRAAMTDAELAAEREQRKAIAISRKAARARRGIALKEGP